MKKAVVCLAEYPEPWKVKKQLAFDIWITDAAKVQANFLRKILKNHKNSWEYDFFVTLLWKNKIQRFLEKYEFNKSNILIPKGKTLGQIMKNTFSDLFQEYDQVVIIGTDVPTVDKKTIAQAFKQLQNKDLVLWPTQQGKSYLVGAKAIKEDVFQNFCNNPNSSIERMMLQADKHDISFSLLEEKRLIDSYKDLLSAAIHNKYYQGIVSMVDGRMVYKNFFA